MAGDGDDPMGVQGGSPDSVAGQRALLPSAVKCTDPMAHGAADDQDITFGAKTYTLVQTHCPGFNDYAPDSFSGKIDPSRQEFQSVNNDGAADVNAPYVFRRTSCSE